MITDWKKKDIWTRRDNKFCVEVSRHTVAPSSIDPYEGVNRWAVYAYIYPEHRSFARFEGNSMFQEATSSMPLHCGPSFLRIHRDDDGKIVCYQVGADYHHYGDDRFADYADEGDAASVFFDADELFKWLSDDAEVSE